MQYKEWLDEWLELYVKVTVKERTYRKYRQQANKYLLPALGDCSMNALSAVTLQRFSASLNSGGLAANTVNGIVCLLKASLKRAVSIGVADRQFSDAIVCPKGRENPVTCFSKDEQKRIENYIMERDVPHLFGILLCLYSGLRIGELLALTWDDVDFRSGTLLVSKSCHDGWRDGRYCKIIDTTKTQSSVRVIPLPRKMVAYMREIRKKTKSRYVIVGRSTYGAQVRSYQRTFEQLLQKLHIKHKGFHALRHTFATRALEVGMDVKTLSEILGHKNPVVTLQRYAHSLTEHKRDMMNRVGRLLG